MDGITLLSRAVRALSFAPLLFLAAGCAVPPAETAQVGSSELGAGATMSFDAEFRTTVAGVLQKESSARVAYDPSRLTACRGEQAGKPQWSITGYYRLAGGPIHAFDVAGLVDGPANTRIELDRSGDLEIWFQNTNRWGCSAFDSAFGANYHFAVAPAAREPGWMGNVRWAIDRATCNGGPCDSALKPVTTDIVYETYARQRAAIRAVQFQVWKDGVTDRDDPDLWKKLDVQVHSRVVGTTVFESRYVSFDHRVGNNALYSIDLRDLDSVKGMGTITDPAKCPSYPVTSVPGTNETYIEAPVEFFVTVNGAELRPAGTPMFVVRYQNYAGLYAPCVSGGTPPAQVVPTP